MKILAFIDMHGSLQALKKIKHKAKNADIIVCGGDFTIFEQNFNHFLQEFNKIKKPFLIIHGNHEEEDLLRHKCQQYKNIFFINNKHFIKEDILFLGWGGGGFSQKDKGFEKRAKKFKEWIKENKEKAVVLVTHAPPYKTKTDEIAKHHCGNKSIREFIKDNKIDLNICGHLHENHNTQDKIDKSTVINPGPYGRIIKI